MPDPTNLEYEYRKQRYETYTKERDALRKDSLEVSGRYDRAILALAGGALALSITFLEKIAPNPAAWTFFILAASWISLIASVLLELYALASSQTVTNEQIRVGDEEYRQYLLSLPEHPQLPAPLKPPATLEAMEARRASTRSYNDWSRWLLTIGVLLLCGFSLFNLPMSNKGTVQPLHESKGSYVAPSSALPPPPPPATPQVAPAQSAPASPASPASPAAPAQSAPAAPATASTPTGK
jgi:hypothetical protein